MSFSDFGRNAMAALSPRVGATAAPPSGVRKSRNARRSSDPLPTTQTTVDGRRRKSRHSDVDAADPPTNANTLEIQRGVRPRLDNIRCPVTKKTLLEDVDASLASTSISSSTTDDHDSEDEYSQSDIGLNQSTTSREEEAASLRNHKRNSNSKRGSSYLNGRKGDRRTEREFDGDSRRAVRSNTENTSQQPRRRLPKHYNNIPGAATTQPKQQKRHDSHTSGRDKRDNSSNNTPTKPTNPLSKLSAEVAQFQKMVADLESLAQSSASSPEAMWKSRILRRSAQEANTDLALALEADQKISERTEANHRNSAAASAMAASRKKMRRDYHRASEQFRSVIATMEQRQKAEISCLTANEAAATEGGTVKIASKRMLLGAEEAEEDFFERAMRERQEEVQKISDGMKKVQEIYTDLAGLVDGQQDQIDQLEDLNEDVKADTKAGLEEIQHGMWKLCLADQQQQQPTKSSNPYNNSFDGTTANNNKKNRTKNVLDPSDIFNCVMACQEPSGGAKRGPRLSLNDDDLYHERSNANYYRDDVTAASSGKAWSLLNLEDIQESAQDAYERGHAMVGGLVGQVVGDEGIRSMSCTPQNEDLLFADDDNEDATTNNETTSGSSTVSEEPYCDNTDDHSEVDDYYHNPRKDKSPRSRSRSRQRSRSRSTPKHDKKHRSRHHKNHNRHDEWEEERYGHEEARHERRQRKKGSTHRKRAN